ncbi:MAG TPA: hypothetical protein VH349_15750 [Ktedonobacterales bacterium]|jgi:hypothetical protein
MPFPLVDCGPQPFTTWLFGAAIGAVILALETLALVVLTRRHGWGVSIVLAVATLVAVGLTLALGLHAGQYASDVASDVGCDANGMFLVTAADSAQVLSAYEAAGRIFGAVMGLLLFGSLITIVSLVWNGASAGRASQI